MNERQRGVYLRHRQPGQFTFWHRCIPFAASAARAEKIPRKAVISLSGFSRHKPANQSARLVKSETCSAIFSSITSHLAPRQNAQSRHEFSIGVFRLRETYRFPPSSRSIRGGRQSPLVVSPRAECLRTLASRSVKTKGAPSLRRFVGSSCNTFFVPSASDGST